MNKKTESPKKRGKLATILIGLGGLLVVCCGLSAVGAVISPKAIPTPVATTAAITVKLAEGVTVMPSATAAPMVAPTDVPTAAPLPTATLDAALLKEGYKLAIAKIAGPTGAVLTEFGKLMTDAGKTPALMADGDWQLKMATSLAAMKLYADQFRALAPPPGLEDVDALVEQMADKLTSAADNFAAGLDAKDESKLVTASEDLNAVNALTQEIMQKLGADGQSLAPAAVVAGQPQSADPTGQDGDGNDIVNPSWLPCAQGQIKGSQNNKYHVPDGKYYARTFRNVTCFNSEAEAEAAQFVRAKNQ